MELEGSLNYERPRTRRWIPMVAFVVPVTAFVFVAAWFIRAYVAPPMVAISPPMTLAAAPPAIPKRAQVTYRNKSAEMEPQAQAAASEQPPTDAPVHAPALPVFASLSNGQPTVAFPMPAMPTAAPMTLPQSQVTTAYADPAPDAHAALVSSEPIKGPIPLPQRKPRVNVAGLATGPVPLPRPRPAEATPAPAATEEPSFDRHAVQ